MVEWMAILQSLAAKPHGNFISGYNGRVGAFRNVRRIGQVVPMAVRDQDIIRRYGFRINVPCQIVARDERIKLENSARDLRREAGMAVVSDFHVGPNLNLSLNLNPLALCKIISSLCSNANGF